MELIFFKFQIISKAEKYALAVIRFFCHSALLLTFSFCYYFTICSYPWRYKLLPRRYTACCNVFQPEMQQNKMHFYCRSSFCQRGPCRSAHTSTLAACMNPGKWGFKPEKSSQKGRGTSSSSDGERPQVQTEHENSPKQLFWEMFMSQITLGAAPQCHF